MAPVFLFLIRHGHVAADGRLCGHTDLPLSPQGETEAACAATALADVPLHAIYTSDLTRSKQTARTIAAPHRLSQTVDAGLRERHFGTWEGALPAHLNTQHPSALARLWNDPDFAPPGGETARELTDRVLSAMARLTACHAGKTVAVVAHGGSIRAVLAHHLGAGITNALRMEIWPGHGSLLACYPDGGVAVGGINLPASSWVNTWQRLSGNTAPAQANPPETTPMVV